MLLFKYIRHYVAGVGGNPVFSSFLSFLTKRKKASAKKEKPFSFYLLGIPLLAKEKSLNVQK